MRRFASSTGAPTTMCRLLLAFVERLQKAGKDVRLTEYADAHHVFDSPAFKTPVQLPQGQTERNCRMEEVIEGKVINSRTRQPFTYADPCVERGPTVAYNEAAHLASLQAVRQFMRATFKLD